MSFRYTLGEEAVVGRKVKTRDRSAGLPGTLVAFNFVTAGYTPTANTGTPVDDTSKGALLVSLFAEGDQGNPPIMLVGGNPYPASDVPCRIYVTADGLEPYLPYVMQSAGTYRGKIVFRRDGKPDITDEWEETWQS